ncbi:MAG: c-type cytochrome [Deltaproteobacteria bacterium]|nr:c-type cytochrome [Deltaproteobacteria bacterium]
MKTLPAALLLLSAPAFAAGFELGGNAARGAETYKTMCSSCHGATGKGDGAASAALNPKPANFQDAARAASVTDEYIYKMIKNGGAANGKSAMMVAWSPALDDGKIRDVSAYVRSLAPRAAPTAPAADTTGKGTEKATPAKAKKK